MLDDQNADAFLSDEEESNAHLSNDEAKAGAVIASSPAFSHNELRKYMPMSGTGSIENSFNHGTRESGSNRNLVQHQHTRQPSGQVADLNNGTPSQFL